MTIDHHPSIREATNTMSNLSGIREISFTVEEDFVPTPRVKPNRHGQLRIPSDHPVHGQRQRIREAARAAGAMPVADVAMEVKCVIHGNISNAKGSSAVGAIQEALEGVAFKDRSQVGRFTLSLEPEIGGQAPFFSVVVKCLGNPFDTL